LFFNEIGEVLEDFLARKLVYDFYSDASAARRARSRPRPDAE
jgi:hypothetical protein